MQAVKPLPQIEVEIQLPPDGRLNEVGFYIRSVNGQDLSPQDILDGVCDALQIDFVDKYIKPPLESFDA